MENTLLQEESIIKILNKLTHNNKDFRYELEKSKTTESMYIVIHYKELVKRSCRISDHLSDKRLLNTLLIGKHTKRKTVEAFLSNVIKKLLNTYSKEIKND